MDKIGWSTAPAVFVVIALAGVGIALRLRPLLRAK
jgi:hypothetical protein